MSFALRELAHLLATDAPAIGAVVGIDGAVVRVATARGAVTARTFDALSVGDRVQIKNGIATKAPVAKQGFQSETTVWPLLNRLQKVSNRSRFYTFLLTSWTALAKQGLLMIYKLLIYLVPTVGIEPTTF